MPTPLIVELVVVKLPLQERLRLAEDEKRTAIALAEAQVTGRLEKEAAKKEAGIELLKGELHGSDPVRPDFAYRSRQWSRRTPSMSCRACASGLGGSAFTGRHPRSSALNSGRRRSTKYICTSPLPLILMGPRGRTSM